MTDYADIFAAVDEMEEDIIPLTPLPSPNAQQLLAINAPVDSAVRMMAGPGSGKTLAIAFRYARLLEYGISPESILAVTHTRVMADELLSRIARVSPSVLQSAAANQVSTIHAACSRILKQEGDNRKICGEWQIKKKIQELAEQIFPNASDRPAWKEIYSWINSAKMNGYTMGDDINYFESALGESKDYAFPLSRLRERFDKAMRDQKHLTFADQLLDVEVKLREDEKFRLKWQLRFTHVIVDEGQDTTAQAMRILTTLAEPQNCFFICGDSDQLLFRFAGATPEANLFEGFESRYPDGLTVMLEINYRSTKAIIDAQLKLIGNNYDENGGVYEDKYLKTLVPRADAPEGNPVTFLMYPTVDAEVRGVVGTLMEEMHNGSEPGDFFIGARTKAQLGYLEGELVREKIPFINITGQSFWTQRHVQALTNYVMLAMDINNSSAFKTVYNIASSKNMKNGAYFPTRYLGHAFLAKCKNQMANAGYAVGTHKAWAKGVRDLTRFLLEVRKALDSGGIANGIRYVLNNCYIDFLKEDGVVMGDISENKFEDIATVIDIAEQIGDIDDFIAYVKDAEQAAEDARNKDWAKYVIISTVHRLKGLERPIVFGMGMSEGVDTGLLPHTYSKTPPPQFGKLPSGGMGRIEDERCITFVLVSRAKDKCYLTGCAGYKKEIFRESRFIAEMGLAQGASPLPAATPHPPKTEQGSE